MEIEPTVETDGDSGAYPDPIPLPSPASASTVEFRMRSSSRAVPPLRDHPLPMAAPPPPELSVTCTLAFTIMTEPALVSLPSTAPPEPIPVPHIPTVTFTTEFKIVMFSIDAFELEF
jgi:hypothetical protein